MIYNDKQEYIKKISQAGKSFKLMALDIGSKKTGIAFYDSQAHLSLPLTIISSANIIAELKNLMIEYDITALVIGYPFGYKSKSTKFIEKMAGLIVAKLNMDILFVDEKLTTAEANSILRDMGMKRKQRNEIDDMHSAKLILDNFVRDTRL